MRLGIVAGLALMVGVLGAGADEVAEAMRGIVGKHADAVVQLKLTIKQTYTIPEYGSEVEESTEEILATVISAEGGFVLRVVSAEAVSAGWFRPGVFALVVSSERVLLGPPSEQSRSRLS